MDGKLGTIFARAGHDVVFNYSHCEKKLERLACDAGDHVSNRPRLRIQPANRPYSEVELAGG